MATREPAESPKLVPKGLVWLGRNGLWLLGMGTGTGGLGLAIYTAVAPEGARGFYDRFGNGASVWGLIVGAAGFALTLWTIGETQRIERESRKEIEAAVQGARDDIAASQAQTREALAKIGFELTKTVCREAHRRLTDAIVAIRHQQWARAAEKCQEGREACRRLAACREVESPERTALEASAEELTATIRYIDKAKVQRTVPSSQFADQHREPLDRLLNAVEKLASRLERQALESPHAND